MTAPKIRPDITIGNIVSWTIIACGFLVGYTKLQDASAQSIKDVGEAKNLAINVQERLNQSEKVYQREAGDMKTDIAVIKSNVLTINDKLDQIRDNQRTR